GVSLITPRRWQRRGARSIRLLAAQMFPRDRWGVLAQTTEVAALALVQPLHGFTFALLHGIHAHHHRHRTVGFGRNSAGSLWSLLTPSQPRPQPRAAHL